MNKLIPIILVALAVAACGIKQGYYSSVRQDPTIKKEDERMDVVYRYVSGRGELQGTCKPAETLVTVFCEKPNRYGEVIAPTDDESQAVGVCSVTDGARHTMTLGCSRL